MVLKSIKELELRVEGMGNRPVDLTGDGDVEVEVKREVDVPMRNTVESSIEDTATEFDEDATRYDNAVRELVLRAVDDYGEDVVGTHLGAFY